MLNGGNRSKVTVLEVGFCCSWERIANRSKAWHKVKFPARVILVEDPVHGNILIDTGYGPAYFEQVKCFPFILQDYLLPAHLDPKDALTQQLKGMGVDPRSIKTVILTHFHADHIANTREFPNASFIDHDLAWQSVKDLKGWKAMRHSYFPNCLPDDYCKRRRGLSFNDTVSIGGFHCLDIFGDQRWRAILLPGHTQDMMGIFIEDHTFYVADAAWSLSAIQHNTLPNFLGMHIQDNKKAYQETLTGLHQFYMDHPDVTIITCHDPQSLK